MTLTLPKNRNDLMRGSHKAQGIIEAGYAAYWLQDCNPERALYHYQIVHDSFAALADKLGYDVSRKAAPADVVAS